MKTGLYAFQSSQQAKQDAHVYPLRPLGLKGCLATGKALGIVSRP